MADEEEGAVDIPLPDYTEFYDIVADIHTECDNLKEAVVALREQLDAAQADGSKDVIKQVEKDNRSPIRKYMTNIETHITKFVDEMLIFVTESEEDES